ncbi:hypothetical protein BGC07_18585 [Piscirickettsia litoralis]|uniref:Uncharacterized protein n=2 Tax=Piscirickettsia litoralis TaxID=1891921 RepID=A0ABX3A4L0_9GAMM|nr:hypothetical protein BGC07_18585 [Piscirickettsia litoralis]
MYGIGGILILALVLLWRYETRQSAQHEVRHEIAQASWKHNTQKFYSEQERLKNIQLRYFSKLAARDEEHDDVDHELLQSLYESKNWSDTDIPSSIFAKLCQAKLVDQSQSHRCKSAIQLIKPVQNNKDSRTN